VLIAWLSVSRPCLSCCKWPLAVAFDNDVIVAVGDVEVLLTELGFKTVIARLTYGEDECAVL
jgi:hypothetical protein